MTDKVLRRFKDKIKFLSLSPFADGRFEVYLDGHRIFSKLESKQFPDEEAVLDELARPR